MYIAAKHSLLKAYLKRKKMIGAVNITAKHQNNQ